MAYQDITFVAGEVLTATKMNQIQTNINFVKNGVEDGSLIGEGVIVSDNIKLDTFEINPKFMQCGTGTVNVQKNNSIGGVTALNFPTPFDNAPNVVVAPQVFETLGVSLAVSSITVNSFGVTGRVNGTNDLGNRTFQWIAIDLTQPPLIAK